MSGFKSESELMEIALKEERLHQTLGYLDWERWEISELDGFFGIPDYVLGYGKHSSDGRQILRTVAIEFKLSNWKRALDQAFRYLLFADYSYIVMDETYVDRAVRNIEEFKRSNIGLLSVSAQGVVKIHFKPGLSQYRDTGAKESFNDLVRGELFNEELNI